MGLWMSSSGTTPAKRVVRRVRLLQFARPDHPRNARISHQTGAKCGRWRDGTASGHGWTYRPGPCQRGFPQKQRAPRRVRQCRCDVLLNCVEKDLRWRSLFQRGSCPAYLIFVVTSLLLMSGCRHNGLDYRARATAFDPFPASPTSGARMPFDQCLVGNSAAAEFVPCVSRPDLRRKEEFCC